MSSFFNTWNYIKKVAKLYSCIRTYMWIVFSISYLGYTDKDSFCKHAYQFIWFLENLGLCSSYAMGIYFPPKFPSQMHFKTVTQVTWSAGICCCGRHWISLLEGNYNFFFFDIIFNLWYNHMLYHSLLRLYRFHFMSFLQQINIKCSCIAL